MRKITQQAVNAFYARRDFKSSNTTVTVHSGTTILYLHSNPIAWLGDDDLLTISSAGWRTATTKERLNGLRGVSIYQKAGVWFLNGEEWDGLTTNLHP